MTVIGGIFFALVFPEVRCPMPYALSSRAKMACFVLDANKSPYPPSRPDTSRSRRLPLPLVMRSSTIRSRRLWARTVRLVWCTTPRPLETTRVKTRRRESCFCELMTPRVAGSDGRGGIARGHALKDSIGGNQNSFSLCCFPRRADRDTVLETPGDGTHTRQIGRTIIPLVVVFYLRNVARSIYLIVSQNLSGQYWPIIQGDR